MFVSAFFYFLACSVSQWDKDSLARAIPQYIADARGILAELDRLRSEKEGNLNSLESLSYELWSTTCCTFDPTTNDAFEDITISSTEIFVTY